MFSQRQKLAQLSKIPFAPCICNLGGEPYEAQVEMGSAYFIPCLLYVSCVPLSQHLQGVDCELKQASRPDLLTCDWLASKSPVDELESD